MKYNWEEEKEKTEETKYLICQIHNFDYYLTLSLIANVGLLQLSKVVVTSA